MSLQYPVIYIRGISTAGSDNIKAGPLDFGPMHSHLQRSFSDKGIHFLPLLGLGATPLADKVKIVRKKLDLALRDLGDGPFHILGHSSGGLVARTIIESNKPLKNLISISTIASPHRGSFRGVAVENALQKIPAPIRRILTQRNSIQKKLRVYSSYNPHAVKNLASLNSTHGIPAASIVCSLPKKQMSWPLRVATSLAESQGYTDPSDGIVERDSQEWGHVLGAYPLDHLMQIGFNFYVKPKDRSKNSRIFCDMIETLIKHWQKIESEHGRQL